MCFQPDLLGLAWVRIRVFRFLTDGNPVIIVECNLEL